MSVQPSPESAETGSLSEALSGRDLPAVPSLGELELWAVLTYKDGDEHGWETEFAYLREHHSDRLAELRESILREGIQSPIIIGPDGRIWDGHHRLCIADELGMSTVPVDFYTTPLPPGEVSR